MPRPPILPVLDWAALFARGRDFAAWLAAGESPEHVASMRAAAAAALTDAAEARLRALARPVHVVAFAEDWCGDVVRHVPALERLARAAGDRLRVRYLARADAPEAFVRFLTNGGEAVPKFVFLNDRFTECGHWGPMPARHRGLIARGKACGDVPAARRQVAALYAADPDARETIDELLHLAETAAAPAP